MAFLLNMVPAGSVILPGAESNDGSNENLEQWMGCNPALLNTGHMENYVVNLSMVPLAAHLE
jgi:hypothetical protein